MDQERWSKEFERARQADKYRAFFETTVLATDSANADKRLVGYALLQEFVSDIEYTNKAMLMLEESLSQELRSNTKQGIDEAHRNAVVAIVTALSETHDCGALERAARTIDRVAQRHGKYKDAEESGEVFRVYVRRLLGQAAEVCHTPADFRAVRRPLRDTLVKIPEIGGLTAPVTDDRGQHPHRRDPPRPLPRRRGSERRHRLSHHLRRLRRALRSARGPSQGVHPRAPRRARAMPARRSVPAPPRQTSTPPSSRRGSPRTAWPTPEVAR